MSEILAAAMAICMHHALGAVEMNMENPGRSSAVVLSWHSGYERCAAVQAKVLPIWAEEDRKRREEALKAHSDKEATERRKNLATIDEAAA